MALLELKTNLKSLRYQGPEKPLVTKDINNPPKTNSFSMAVNHRLDDVARLSKLLTKKQGLKFVGNQALLNLTNIKQDIEKVKTKVRDAKKDPDNTKTVASIVAKDALSKLKETAINTVLATASILAQSPASGTGLHIPRGLKPNTYLRTGPASGIATLKGKDGAIIPNNIASKNPDDNNFQGGEPLAQTENLASKDLNKVTEGDEYLKEKGPLSVKQRQLQATSGELDLGLDNSGISGFTPPIEDKKKEEYKKAYKIFYKPNRSTGAEISNAHPLEQNESRTNFNPDGGDDYDDIRYVKKSNSFNDSSNSVPQERRDEIINGLGLEDKPDSIQSLGTKTESILGTEEEDIIPFEFNTYYPGNTEGKFIYFRAFLDSLSDNFSSEWNSIKYVGRADNFYSYNGFDRSITFAFKVAAFSKTDIQPIYDKLNALVGSTAPTYSTNGEFMKGTLTKITIGDYIVGLNGYVESIGLSWNTTYPWEMGIDSEETLKVPHVLDVNVSFKPIHDFAPTANSTYIANV